MHTTTVVVVSLLSAGRPELMRSFFLPFDLNEQNPLACKHPRRDEPSLVALLLHDTTLLDTPVSHSPLATFLFIFFFSLYFSFDFAWSLLGQTH
ncbi:hypothetical protein BDV33DRAFT_167337 [Aspergillus novoparasiticus]|uniref:Uncharacterized protein n=1 Tax=Aspergillus novoparasiticus TaxID=986946 RepID=A0A5N6F385_9EURO|nr:hypothetical protein BDV33DRAFT_167337 [Aspergillus novoparasiticus]